ncbi:MAG: hypothetical protein K9K35_07685 [Rhodoferax sp.]|nr:hypothetical protein [Rhodoferax sp.]
MKNPVTAAVDVNTRSRTHKQYLLRLPVALAARLEALCELHPETRRDQVFEDLLGLGLTELERHSSRTVEGGSDFEPDLRAPVYLLSGPFAEFRDLVRKHHFALEQELAKVEAAPDRLRDAYQVGDME